MKAGKSKAQRAAEGNWPDAAGEGQISFRRLGLETHVALQFRVHTSKKDLGCLSGSNWSLVL